MRPSIVFAFCLLVGAPAFADTPAVADRGTDWSPQRATGPKDVNALGDSVNAWATASADSGAEWLKLGYAEALPIKEIRIWQNDAPGAIARVSVTVDGAEVDVWSGRDTVGRATAPVEKVITLPKPYISDTVTVHLDTARVSGWNEIDAVQIVATDGRRVWAQTATASSTYASHGGAGGGGYPLSHLVGKQVTIRTVGGPTSGTVSAVDYTWITVTAGSKTVLINQAHAATIEWRD